MQYHVMNISLKVQNKIAGLGSYVANFNELETSNFWYQNKTNYNKNI